MLFQQTTMTCFATCTSICLSSDWFAFVIIDRILKWGLRWFGVFVCSFCLENCSMMSKFENSGLSQKKLLLAKDRWQWSGYQPHILFQAVEPGIEYDVPLYCHKTNFSTSSYHPLLSDNPLHRGSVRTFLSMSFFHSIPSEITLYHSLQTLSAAHKEVASKKDRIFSAIWSKPLAVEQNRKELSLKEIMAIFHGKCIIRS